MSGYLNEPQSPTPGSPSTHSYTGYQNGDVPELRGNSIVHSELIRPPSSVPPRHMSGSVRASAEPQKSPLDVFREHYKIDAIPKLNQLRIQGTVQGHKVYSDIVQHKNSKPYFSLGFKPGEQIPLIKKIVLTPQKSDLRFFTSPVSFGILRLQVGIGYDWCNNMISASWRCKTKWTRGSKITKRVPIVSGDGFDLTTFWNLRHNFPEIGGQIGQVSNVKTDIGRFDLSLTRVKACIKL